MNEVNVAILILYDKEGRILLQHRSYDAPAYAGYWGFFGGHIGKEEEANEAAKREAMEEINYSLHGKLWYETYYVDPSLNRIGKKYFFIEECKDKSPIKLQEGQGLGWFTPESTMKLKLSDANRLVIEKLKQKLR